MPKLCFEHQSLRLDKDLDDGELKSLQSFYGSGKDFPYYKLIHNGIKFCEYVGVIQVGKLVIEVLPKIDKEENPSAPQWQKILIGMLQAAHDLDTHTPGYSSLKLKPNSILEMYFEIFIREVEYLVRTGMVCKYRRYECNQYALKGRLVFAKQIQKNLVHQERFYTRTTIYDHEHIWHIILYQATILIKRLCNKASLHSRIEQLELCFPPMPNIPVTAETFGRLHYNRQTDRYRKAIEIARLLLLNFHPDVRKGENNVLALMFDMNALWERFVYCSLRKHLRLVRHYTLYAQKKHPFWETKQHITPIKPDILITSLEPKGSWIWDTKWKLPDYSKPSSGDLQQMYAYAGILNAKNVALVYPGEGDNVDGKFIHRKDPERRMACSVIYIPVEKNITKWQNDIYECFELWRDGIAE